MRVGAGKLLVAAGLLAAGGGCASSRSAYRPDELRQEVLRIAPGIAPADLVVPFELPAEALALARRTTGSAAGELERLERLVLAFFDPALFGVRYDGGATNTGAEALAARRGNCVGLASAFVGLARAVGLDARFVDASTRVRETRASGHGTTVTTGHVTAMVLIGNQRMGLDFARQGTFRWYRELDDLEALAHYYNNRGYEQVAEAMDEGEPADWAGAERLFRLAIRVKPTFARAWSNLGIAAARLGDTAAASASYEQAMVLDPDLAAPRVNLGTLRLEAGDVAGALEALRAAAALEPRAAHVQFQLARALLRAGDRAGAVQALERTLALQADFPGARALLDRLRTVAGRG